MVATVGEEDTHSMVEATADMVMEVQEDTSDTMVMAAMEVTTDSAMVDMTLCMIVTTQ